MPYFTNGDIKIHYQVEGSGQPLLLAHQATDSIDYWYRNGYVAKLKDNFQLIMPDARGHGQSDKPHDPDAYHARFVVEDFCTLLDLVEVPKCHFWGYSMGGFSALHFALRYPSRLMSIIIGGAYPQTVENEFANRVKAGFKIGINQGSDALIAYFEDWWGPMAQPLAERFRNLDYVAMWAVLHQGGMRLDVTKNLPDMNVSALFYTGSEDVAPQKYAPLAAEMMPNAHFISFPGYTHGTMSPEADLVLAHVLPFLAKNS